ncbi:MAG: hypothetical protein FWE09_03010 [Treponema sp.]|nr:hypothetical protein [Treponema sp.]
MNTEKQVARLIQRAFDRLKPQDAGAEGNLRIAEALDGASALLEDALEADYDNEEVKCFLSSVAWWRERLPQMEGIADPFDRGEFILSKIRQYHAFLDNLPYRDDLCQYMIKRFVFSCALGCFAEIIGGAANNHDPGLLLLVGRCYKGVGIYVEALRYVEQATRFRREDAETLAELADVNALLGEDETAKALFREAFFLSPERIDLQMMESDLILRLRNKILREKGFREEELREWMPVYGKLWGVFSIRRALKPAELTRLKQSIYNMETECRGNPGRGAALKPRLINRYFWLIDHYDDNGEDPSLREEVLLKIKFTDPEIYERYVQ